MDPDVSRASTRSTGRLCCVVVVDDGDVEGVTETSVCEEEGVYVMIHGEHGDDEDDCDVEEAAIIIFNVIVVAVTLRVYVCM